MAFVRPQGTADGAPASLMANQDLAKGDRKKQRRKRDKSINFWVTEEQRDRFRAYADARGVSLSRLIVETLEERIERDGRR